MDLHEVRQKVIDRHKLLESVSDCPWSPDHPIMKEQMFQGDKILSERPTAIQVDDRVHIVAECVPVVRAAMQSFMAKAAADPEKDLIGNGIKFQKATIKNCERAIAQGDHMELPTQDWNYCLAALAAENVKVVIVGA